MKLKLGRFRFSLNFRAYLADKDMIGISSKVDNVKSVGDSVLFCDFDEKMDLGLIKKVSNECSIPIYFLIESSREGSKRKYHLISPIILPFPTALNLSMRMGSCSDFLNLSSIRNEFVLRINKKGNKPNPSMKYYILNKKNAGGYILNYAHIRFLCELGYGVDREVFRDFRIGGTDKLSVSKNTYLKRLI